MFRSIFIDLGVEEYPSGPIWEIEALARSWRYKPKLTSWSYGMQVGSTLVAGWKSINLLLFYRDELHKIRANQFVWWPYSDKILGEYPLVLHESGCGKLLYCWSSLKLPSGIDLTGSCHHLGCYKCDSARRYKPVLHGFGGWGHGVAIVDFFMETTILTCRSGVPSVHWMPEDDPYMVWYQAREDFSTMDKMVR